MSWLPPVVLLGAGASVQAGVPATYALTQALVDRIGMSPASRDRQRLNFVCGTLVGYDAARGGSPQAALDVERVFSALKLLSERRTLQVSPFVATWHPAVEGWDQPQLPTKFDPRLRTALESGEEAKARDLIARLVDAMTAGGTGEAYRRVARRMIAALKSLMDPENMDVTYLEPLAAVARRFGRLTVATLNYDVTIEELGMRSGVSVDTGLDTWAMTRTWSWPDEGIRLLKLHGSIDWAWTDVPAGASPLPYRTVERVRNVMLDGREAALIFGQREKLTAEGPFLSLLIQFEDLLRKADRLVVIGYSFRDAHINETIRHWIVADERRTIVAVDPSFPESPDPRDFRGVLTQHLDAGRGGGRQARIQRLHVIRAPASEALPFVLDDKLLERWLRDARNA